jgi:hypothetical protein
MCCNVVIAGLIAFNFWEPLASLIEPAFGGYGYEDFLCLLILFCLTLGLMRTMTSLLCPTEIEYPPLLLKPGGALFGLLAGYVTAGILVCMLQTLPWHRQFMYFDAKVESGQALRRYLPPDRMWLALMHHVGAGPLSRGGPTFDERGNFSLRYARHRRHTEAIDRMPYKGEFDPAAAVPPPAPAPAPSPTP